MATGLFLVATCYSFSLPSGQWNLTDFRVETACDLAEEADFFLLPPPFCPSDGRSTLAVDLPSIEHRELERKVGRALIMQRFLNITSKNTRQNINACDGGEGSFAQSLEYYSELLE